MQNRNNLSITVLVIICVFFIFLSLYFFKNVKKMELGYKEQKAVLLKENVDLKARIDSIQNIVDQKIESVNAVEQEKEALENQLAALKAENEKLAASFNDQLEVLRRKNFILRKKVASLENSDLVGRIKEAIENEENGNIKKVLVIALNKVESIKTHGSVAPEPVIERKEDALAQAKAASAGLDRKDESPQPPAGEKSGTILSLDRKNNLIVISFGRKDGVKEGDRCSILQGGGEVAQAEIMGIRYRISAAFIDNFKYKYNISSIREGDKVTLVER